MKNILSILLVLVFISKSQSQHLYPEKFNNCAVKAFCLDCGDEKAKVPNTILNEITKSLNKAAFLKTQGTIEAQIIIFEDGKHCLLSVKNNTSTPTKKLGLENAVNKTSSWTPAISKGKNTNSSVTLVFEFNLGSLKIGRREFNSTNQTNMSSSGEPKAKGTDESKLSYNWTMYTQANSELPWDMSRALSSDSSGAIWIGTDNGIVEIDNSVWKHYNSKNSNLPATIRNKDKTESTRYIEVDKDNNKWFVVGYGVYKFDNYTWTKFDSLNSPINWARKIILDPKKNVWFTSWRGVNKYDGTSWSVINKENSKLPSDKVLGMYVDTKDKLWIGTFEGNAVIENGVTRVINEESSPLSKAFITKAAEDSKGNMWFSLYNDKSFENEGLFKLENENKWSKINFPKSIKNLKRLSIGDFLIDEERNELWVIVNGVGILLYNLDSEKWQIYTNQNSNLISTSAERIHKDKHGDIWVATYGGVAKLNRPL